MIKQLETFIEGLIVGQGEHVGQNFVLLPWQRRFLKGTFSQPGNAALTVARGNGKSVLCSALGAAAVVGPLAQPMASCVIVASSFTQGMIIFDHAKHFLTPWIEKEEKRFRVWQTANHCLITDKQTGSGLKVIGSDPRRMHGLQYGLCICDEVAQWEENKVHSALSAIRTSRGKIPGSKIVFIGTRPADPEHPFQQELDSERGYSQVHCAKEEDKPFHMRTIKKANPSLDHISTLKPVIEEEIEDARKSPQALASFLSLRLNMGKSDTKESHLINPEVWKSIEVDARKPSGPYVLGLDLGQTISISAASAYFIIGGYLDSFGVIASEPSPAERGLAEGRGNIFVKLVEQGDIIVAGQKVSDTSALITEAWTRWGVPKAIVCDRWREKELRQILENINFPLTDIIVRGMGWLDGGQDSRDFLRGCLRNQIKPKRCLGLRFAISLARTISDPAGNVKLKKRQSDDNGGVFHACLCNWYPAQRPV